LDNFFIDLIFSLLYYFLIFYQSGSSGYCYRSVGCKKERGFTTPSGIKNSYKNKIIARVKKSANVPVNAKPPLPSFSHFGANA